MLSVAEALALVQNEVRPLGSVTISLDDALGCVLAADILADQDSPPFDKSLMDGYAVGADAVEQAAGANSGHAAVIDSRISAGSGSSHKNTSFAELTVIEEVTAGRVPSVAVQPGQTVRLMTGAPIPAGTAAVVPVEKSEAFVPDQPGSTTGRVRLRLDGVRPGQHLLRQGETAKSGTVVIPQGAVLRPQEVAVAAEFGSSRVSVVRRPIVGILSTGDELVAISDRPGSGQIRNSNAVMLQTQLQQMQADPVVLGIVRDDPAALTAAIRNGLQSDILLLTGGVSAGKLDLVPGVLAKLGVRQVFHKAKLKPGQPIWFGVFDRDASTAITHPGELAASQPTGVGRCLVFGLPGNPVSSMVCCELFVAAAIRSLSGRRPAIRQPVSVRLTADFAHRGARPTYHPAAIELADDGWIGRTVPWIGSADLAALVSANGMLLFEAGDRDYRAGERVPGWRWQPVLAEV